MIVCRKCRRPCSPWSLPHPGCSPDHWVTCITTDSARHDVDALSPPAHVNTDVRAAR